MSIFDQTLKLFFQKPSIKQSDYASLKFLYPHCNKKKSHHNQFLNIICLNQNCQNRGLICNLCQSQDHQKHQFLPVKIIYSEIRKKYDKIYECQNMQECLKKMQRLFRDVYNSLNGIVEDLASNIRWIQQQLIKMYEQVEQSIINEGKRIKSFCEDVEWIVQCDKDVQKMKFRLQKIIEYVNFNEQKKQLILNNKIDHFVSQYQKKTNQIHKSFISLKQKFKNDTVTIKNIIIQKQSPIQPTSSIIFKFSNKLKPKTVVTSNHQTVAKQIGPNNLQRFALIQPMLNLLKTTKIKFKILKCESWIGLGICFRQIIEVKKYRFDYNNIGHGSYLISSNGYSWSHSRKEDNIKLRQFKFGSGQIICLSFDPIKRLLSFSNKEQFFSISIDIQKDQIPLIYFCVNLCSQKDEVEILCQD